MKRFTRIPIAIACALGVGTASAQTVQRGDANVSNTKPAQGVAQASTPSPVQVAQAGGAAPGATAGGGTATVGLGTTLAVVGASIAAIAISTDGAPTVTH